MQMSLLYGDLLFLSRLRVACPAHMTPSESLDAEKLGGSGVWGGQHRPLTSNYLHALAITTISVLPSPC